MKMIPVVYIISAFRRWIRIGRLATVPVTLKRMSLRLSLSRTSRKKV